MKKLEILEWPHKSSTRVLNKESHGQLKFFSQTWVLTIIDKNTNVNNEKNNLHENLNFNRQKIQKM